jgi:hypothetical protein
MKKDNEMFDAIFSSDQAKIMKQAVVKTTEINSSLKVATLRIGPKLSLLLYGTDLNGNTHYTMLSEESFNKLKKLKIKGV